MRSSGLSFRHGVPSLLLLSGCWLSEDELDAFEDDVPLVLGAPVVELLPADPTTRDDLSVGIVEGPDVPEGTQLAYRYVWSRDGVVVEDPDEATLPEAFTTRGETWTVSVVAEAENVTGESGSASVFIENTVPEATVSLEPLEPVTSDALVARAVGEDADGDVVAWSFQWSRDGETLDSITGDTVPAGTVRRGERWTVTAIPSDGFMDGAASEASRDIANAPPSVGAVGLSPDDPDVGSDIAASVAFVEDLEGDDLDISWVWTIDGAVVLGVDADTLPAGLARRGAEVQAEIVASDGEGGTASALSEPVTVQNTPPTVDSVGISPSLATESSTLSCTATGLADPDDDAVSLTVRWEINGVPGPTATSLDGRSFGRGDTVRCAVTPDDGTESGAVTWSGAVTIANEAPVLAAVTVGPTAATVETELTASVSGAADADGDPIAYRYQWKVDGRTAGTGPTFTPTVGRRGSVVTAHVTPSDGIVDGSEVASLSVVLANAVPVVLSASIAPADAATDDVLSASVTAYDADGDSLSEAVTWAVNGRTVARTATLDGRTYFSRGDTVTMSVVLDDGYDYSTVATVSQTIANTPPTAPVVALAPTMPDATAPLVCTVSGASTDADGDAITYAFTWTRDGVAYTGATTTGTSSSVPVAALASGDVWTCLATATDGTSPFTGSPASVTVCTDEDGDGYSGSACGGADCDDDADNLYPFDEDGDGVLESCGYRDLALTWSQACAIDTDHRMSCWGSGTEMSPSASVAYAKVTSNVKTCALRVDGTLDCWGVTPGAAYGPPGGATFSDVACGGQIGLTVSTLGEVTVWGWNTHSTTPTVDPVTVEQISASYHHACGVLTDGTLKCWPDATEGRIVPDNTYAPYSVVGAGLGFGCALAASDGYPHCFGASNTYGQLDAPAVAMSAIVAGVSSACGITAAGAILCWGDSTYRATAAPSGEFNRIVVGYSGYTGGDIYCAVASDQDIQCWGDGASEFNH